MPELDSSLNDHLHNYNNTSSELIAHSNFINLYKFHSYSSTISDTLTDALLANSCFSLLNSDIKLEGRNNLEFQCTTLLKKFNDANADKEICCPNEKMDNYFSSFLTNDEYSTSNSYKLDSKQQMEVEKEYSSSIFTKQQLIGTVAMLIYAGLAFKKEKDFKLAPEISIGLVPSYFICFGAYKLAGYIKESFASPVENFNADENGQNVIIENLKKIGSVLDAFQFILKNTPPRLAFAFIATAFIAPQLMLKVANPWLSYAANILSFLGVYKVAEIIIQVDHHEILVATITTAVIAMDTIQKHIDPNPFQKPFDNRFSKYPVSNFMFLISGLVSSAALYVGGLYYESNFINNLGLKVLAFAGMKACASTLESISSRHTNSIYKADWRVAPIAAIAASGITTSMVILQNWMKPEGVNLQIELISYDEVVMVACTTRAFQDQVSASLNSMYPNYGRLAGINIEITSLFAKGVGKELLYTGFGIKNYTMGEIIKKQLVSSICKKIPSLFDFPETASAVSDNTIKWFANGFSRNSGMFIYEHTNEVLSYFNNHFQATLQEKKMICFIPKMAFSHCTPAMEPKKICRPCT